MKQALRQMVQGGVARVAPWFWRRASPSLVILMYHRVLPPQHPDRASEQRGMYVSPQTLQMHLEVLREHFTLLHLDDWLTAVGRGEAVPRNACALTFDDGWRDNFDFAWPVLKAAAAPATIYLVSDLVGTAYSFWPNTLARLLTAARPDDLARLPAWLRDLVRARAPGGVPCDAATVDAIIMDCKARCSDEQMHGALAVLGAAGARDLMSWEEIRQMQDSGLVRFGSHTRRHTRLLGSIGPDVLKDEVVGSRAEIARHLGSEPRTFCYPNGDLSSSAVDCVRGTYRGAVTTRAGWNECRSDAWLLKRVGVHEDVAATRAGFLSRLAGVG